MKATATRSGSLRQAIRIRDFHLTIDEPTDKGGEDSGPSPPEMLAASLAACTAITMEMYAKRKGWDVGDVEVACDYTPAERGCPTRFNLVMRFPDSLSDEQVERLRIIAAKCPVHRTLEGEVMFGEKVELVSRPRGADGPPAVRPAGPRRGGRARRPRPHRRGGARPAVPG